MGKHAYCIITHKNIDQVKSLVKALDYPGNDIYIHADTRFAEATAESFSSLASFSKIHFAKQFAPTWGSFAQIEASLLLIQMATLKSRYDYYHLLSGQDFPLKIQADIHACFEGKRCEFVHFSRPDEWDSVIRERIGTHRFPRFSAMNKCFGRIEAMQAGLLGNIRKSMLDSSVRYGFGSQWFSITDGLARRYCNSLPWIREHFSRAMCPDEHALQSFVLTFGYEDALSQRIGDGSYQSCLRYVDWSQGGANPKTLGTEDILPLLDPSSPYCFARKIDFENTPELEDILLNYIGKNRL